MQQVGEMIMRPDRAELHRSLLSICSGSSLPSVALAFFSLVQRLHPLAHFGIPGHCVTLERF